MQNIRNFAIVAHVDHGKSTLADRLLEITGTVPAREMRNQLLDSNPIERERGITIKLAPVRMTYTLNNQSYILNLIDTPGHVDFSYEVNRSLAACEGAVLLIDATQGVQAQTLAHCNAARKLHLKIIPVVNKIDVSTADVESTLNQISEILGFDRAKILKISAKTGTGVDALLGEIVRQIPPPSGISNGPSRALIFNSSFDPHLGVLAWIRVVDGRIMVGDKLHFLATGAGTSAVEVGVFVPDRKNYPSLSAGEVGFVVTGIRDISQITVGDTLTNQSDSAVIPLPGYQPIKPVVFVSFYPIAGSEINALRDALGKLRLTDSALQFYPEFSPALGNGFRVGLLGLLHADVVQERIEREFGISLIAVAPSVEYEILTKNGAIVRISKAMDLPDPSVILEIREPFINLSIFVPADFVGPTIQVCQDHRASLLDMKYLGRLVHLTYTMPLVELIHQFYDQLKSLTQGYATMDYELAGFAASDLVKLDILVSGEIIESLSQIVPKVRSPYIARDLVDRLKSVIPRQQFEIPIQASIGAHVLARADLKGFRKDVIAKLSGGDQTRKDKLLKKQKKGKARMKRIGKVDLPQEAFLSILRVS